MRDQASDREVPRQRFGHPDIYGPLSRAARLRVNLDREPETAADSVESRTELLRRILATSQEILDGVDAYLQACPDGRFTARPRTALVEHAGELKASFTRTVTASVSSWESYQANNARMQRLRHVPADVIGESQRDSLNAVSEAQRQSLALLKRLSSDLQDWLLGVRDELEPRTFVIETSPLRFLSFVETAIERDERELVVIEKTSHDGYSGIALRALYTKRDLSEAFGTYLERLLDLTTDFGDAALARFPDSHSSWTVAIWAQVAMGVRENWISSFGALSRGIDEARAAHDLGTAEKVDQILKLWRSTNAARANVLKQWVRLL